MTALAVRELTPPGAGGVAVVRVEGPGALDAVRALAPGARLEPGAPCFARLTDGEQGLDEALVVVESGERLELHLHGSPPLVRRLVARLGGPATARPRSLEELAAARLAGAPCEAGARILLDQAEGALRRALEELAVAEGAAAAETVRGLPDLLERARIARFALEPARVVLAGPVNAGKSTLFNALVGERRVVTSAERGTTRDAIHERALLGAFAVELVDTAGEREVPDRETGAAGAIEAAGQVLARELRAGADLVIWLSADGAPAPPAEVPVVALRTFADLGSGRSDPRAVSALRDPTGAAATCARLFRAAFDLPEEPWTPGAAVPFEPAQVRALHELGAAEGPERRSALEALLAR
jgi:tRNA modification GTPase